MFAGDVLPFFLLLLLFASLANCFSGWSRLPYPLVLVVVGYLGSELVTRVFRIDTGISWHSFYELIYYGLIPALIFHGATTINVKLLREDILPILLLAIPLMMLASLIAGCLIYFGIGHASGFPWMAALLGGVLMSATDPAAVVSVLKSSGVPKRILVMLEGESLFNDAAAIVLFGFLLQFAVSGQGLADMTIVGAAAELGRVFFGGILVGLVASLLLHVLLRVVRPAESQMLLTLVCVWGGFLVAEKYLHMSGVMAVLVVGLSLGKMLHHEGEGVSAAGQQRNGGKFDRGYVRGSWDFIVHMCESLLFLMGGVTITLNMFTEQWLAILIAIVATLAARFLIIFVPFALFCRLPGQRPVSRPHQFLLMWSGVRGTMTLALALSLPVTLDSWYTIQSMAYGVVVYTLFVQTLTLPLLLEKTPPAGAA